MNLRPEIREAAEWLEREAAADPFAEIAVKLILHKGVVSRVEHTLVTKHKPDGNTGGSHEPRRRDI